MTERTSVPPEDGHAGDLISARLDGELDDEAASWVDAHLRECAACAQTMADAESARAWMRRAPAVDATPVVEGVIARRRRLVANGITFVGVSLVVMGLLSVTAAVSHPNVVPDVEALVAAHRSSGQGDMEGMRAVESGGKSYATPDAIEGPGRLRREAVYDGQDLTTVVYVSPRVRVSVFQQPGRLDWDALPDAGSARRLGDRSVWVRDGEPPAVVTEVGHLVVTVVSDDEDAVLAVVDGLPAPVRSSALDRIHDSCQRLTEIFALGG